VRKFLDILQLLLTVTILQYHLVALQRWCQSGLDFWSTFSWYFPRQSLRKHSGWPEWQFPSGHSALLSMCVCERKVLPTDCRCDWPSYQQQTDDVDGGCQCQEASEIAKDSANPTGRSSFFQLLSLNDS